MAIPASIEARLFYRCAFQRYEDAVVLLRAEHTTGAVYLAGYGVECILKALVLSTSAPAARSQMLKLFRGTKAHDFEWLRTQYLLGAGPPFSREVIEAFTLVNTWSTGMRYLPRKLRKDAAASFLTAARNIIHWADGRL
jgi:HEPN domain-containing protein